MDATDRPIERLREELEYRNRFEDLIVEISSRLIREPGTRFDVKLQAALEEVGRFAGVDRAYVFLFRENLEVGDNTHEWCGEGIEPQIEQLQGVPTALFPWWMERFARGENVFVPRVEALENPEERGFLAEQGIDSLIAVPVAVGDELLGFVGFDWVGRLTGWSADQVRLLRLVGNLFANAVQRERATLRLERMEEQLQQTERLDAIGRLASGIAHDFNNLLTTVLAHGRELQDRLGEDPEAAGHVDAILRGGEGAASLVRQLLEFSSRRPLEDRSVDLDEIVDRTLDLVGPLLGRHVEVHRRLGGAGQVRVDPGQLERVVLNVLTNARDAMPLGGTLEVETRRLPGEERVELVVRDRGSGIPEEYLGRVFDPFFTTKPTGTGLGLASVHGIVHQSGGSVVLANHPEGGAIVRILLPSPAAEPAPEQVVDLAPAGRETVLLVDDEPAILEVLTLSLERRGYRVLSAAGLETALAAAGRERVDLVVTDLVLPGATGFDIVERLVATHGQVPALVMSGYGPEEIGSDAGGSTGVAFLQKPFSPNELLRRIRRVLDDRNAA